MHDAGVFDLTGKVSIVTGGVGGLGCAVAMGLAEFGSDIVLADFSSKGSRELIKKIKGVGREAIFVRVDVTRKKDIDNMVSRALKKFGKIDVLVNNAGRNVRKPAVEITEKDWDTVLDTNLKGAFFCTQAVGKAMLKRKKGKVINMASVMGMVGSADYQSIVPYCASKGGMVQLTRAFATEWAKRNVQVNAIAPAIVETPLVKQLTRDRKKHKRIVNMIPMGRMATTEELVGPIVFLASDASNYMTGHILHFDGGWLAQ